MAVQIFNKSLGVLAAGVEQVADLGEGYFALCLKVCGDLLYHLVVCRSRKDDAITQLDYLVPVNQRIEQIFLQKHTLLAHIIFIIDTHYCEG